MAWSTSRGRGRKPTITAQQVEDVVVATLESTPEHATHWSRKKMAERSGLSKSTIGRIWKGFGLKPHLVDGFKLSNDPLFVRSTTSTGSTSTLPTPPLSCAWTRSRRSKRWEDRSRHSR